MSLAHFGHKRKRSVEKKTAATKDGERGLFLSVPGVKMQESQFSFFSIFDPLLITIAPMAISGRRGLSK
jgi:hypothetical protein